MVSLYDKQRSTQYICDLLEESGSYVVKQRTDRVVEVREKCESEVPHTFKIVMANFFTAAEFEKGLANNRAVGVDVTPVLYKDGKTAFVRMVDRNPSWRSDKSLKNYSPRDINRMLHLRKIEKVVLDRFYHPIQYYQPETALLRESVRSFLLLPVDLDYRHIGPNHPSYGFVHNHPSIDYKLPEEVFPSAGLVGLMMRRGRALHFQDGVGSA